VSDHDPSPRYGMSATIGEQVVDRKMKGKMKRARSVTPPRTRLSYEDVVPHKPLIDKGILTTKFKNELLKIPLWVQNRSVCETQHLLFSEIFETWRTMPLDVRNPLVALDPTLYAMVQQCPAYRTIEDAVSFSVEGEQMFFASVREFVNFFVFSNVRLEDEATDQDTGVHRAVFNMAPSIFIVVEYAVRNEENPATTFEAMGTIDPTIGCRWIRHGYAVLRRELPEGHQPAQPMGPPPPRPPSADAADSVSSGMEM
jgi:hypothetical protein